jgi:hypothetical protein
MLRNVKHGGEGISGPGPPMRARGASSCAEACAVKIAVRRKRLAVHRIIRNSVFIVPFGQLVMYDITFVVIDLQ